MYMYLIQKGHFYAWSVAQCITDIPNYCDCVIIGGECERAPYLKSIAVACTRLYIRPSFHVHLLICIRQGLTHCVIQEYLRKSVELYEQTKMQTRTLYTPYIILQLNVSD